MGEDLILRLNCLFQPTGFKLHHQRKMAELNYRIFCHQLEWSIWVAQISLDLIDRQHNYGKCVVGNVGRWGKGVALVLRCLSTSFYCVCLFLCYYVIILPCYYMEFLLLNSFHCIPFSIFLIIVLHFLSSSFLFLFCYSRCFPSVLWTIPSLCTCLLPSLGFSTEFFSDLLVFFLVSSA